MKLRRRSLHDSSRNINEKIDTADKSSSTEPGEKNACSHKMVIFSNLFFFFITDGKLTELQLEINHLMSETAKLKREKRSMISDFENKLHETHKVQINLSIHIYTIYI